METLAATRFTEGTTMRLLVTSLSCLVIFVCNSPTFGQSSSSPYGGGGRIGATGKATDLVQEYNQAGKAMRIEGTCRSSCTMLLAVKNVCVDPNATLLFHAALLKPNQKLNPQKQAAMLRAYNAKLRNYLVSNHYVDSFEFHSISGRRIIDEFGYRACK